MLCAYLQWLVSTVEEDPLTVVQRFTSPSCSVDPDKEWQTYLIYEVRVCASLGAFFCPRPLVPPPG